MLDLILFRVTNSKFCMRARRIFAVAIVVCLVALLTMLLWPGQMKLDPPSISIVSIERAGVDDDEGKEMWLVTVGIHNPNSAPFADESLYVAKFLYVEDEGQPIEVHVTNRWVAITGRLGCDVRPGDMQTTAWVVPGGADACRASLKYTNFELYSGRLAVHARRLPRALRSRFPASFWQWAGLPRSRPSSNWQEIKIEVPFPNPNSPLPQFGE